MRSLELLLQWLLTATALNVVWNDCVDPRFNECTAINGTPQDDILEQTASNQCVVVLGKAGEDTITGSSYGDCINGGPGKDVIYGGDGDDYTMGRMDREA